MWFSVAQSSDPGGRYTVKKLFTDDPDASLEDVSLATVFPGRVGLFWYIV